jgi:hypothetical protein
MRPEEGVEALTRILDAGLDGTVVVSTGDLGARLDRWLSLERAPPQAPVVERFARPDLHNEFVPPRDEVESAVAELWGELFGLERVGVFDDFFALGGNSLVATQLVSRLRRSFHVELGLRALFADPTVAGLAKVVREAEAAQEQARALAVILDEIEQLPIEQVESELLQQAAGQESARP